jgi:sugar/nucleoside kinase (ribokinase family)
MPAPVKGPVIGSLGELLVEFVCTDTDTGHLSPANYAGPYPSGAPGIYIDQAARLTGRAIFAGAVGDDAFGRVILNRLRANGVDDCLIRIIPGLPTGTAHVGYNGDGSRSFVFNIAQSAASHFLHGDQAEAGFCAAGCSLLHISGSTLGNATMAARAHDLCMRLARHGTLISIDPNIRAELMTDSSYIDTVRAIIAMADFVLPSDADAALLWPETPFADWSASLPRARSVILKQGHQGCSARAGRDILTLPAHPVSVIDPTGAGDCFCATFTALTLMGHALPDALRLANAAGALAVCALGPMEGNAPLSAITAMAGTG